MSQAARPDPRLEAAVARFEGAHGEDPRFIDVDGTATAWSVHYHRRLAHWVSHFDPEASVPLRLAAACQHVRRWEVPRDDYEQGRRGYRRWRTELSKRHAEIAREVLEDVGYDELTVVRVEELLRKVGLGRDPEMQLFEDAICMVFFENELVDLASKHDDAKMIDILRRTWAKMSEEGRRAALAFLPELPIRERGLIEAATSGEGS